MKQLTITVNAIAHVFNYSVCDSVDVCTKITQFNQRDGAKV